MSDSELESDREDNQAPEPTWVPSCLPATEQRLALEADDTLRIGNNSCLLCELADPKTKCAPKIKEIYDFEHANRRNIESSELYKAIARKFNEEIVQFRRQWGHDTNARTITVPEVRRHFLGNHDRDILRMMENRMDYLDSMARALEEGGLWMRNARDPSQPLMPNRQNVVTYINVTREQHSLYKELRAKNGVSRNNMVGKRKPKVSN